MGIRAPRRRPTRIKIPRFIFSLVLSVFVVFAGCAAPGEPTARRAPVPAPITDLSAKQSGNSAILTFTLPRDTIERRLLKRAPEIEIYREFSSVAPQTAPAPTASIPHTGTIETPPATSPSSMFGLSLAMTIPSALVSHYQQGGTVRYVDPWTSEILQQHAGESVTYMVRSAESPTKSSPESNLASLRVYVAPDPISDLKAQLSRAAIDLAWTAPQQTPIGPVPAISGYEIYRTEVPSAITGKQSATTPQMFPIPGEKEASSQPVRVATTQSTGYEDSQVTLGAAYNYFVRSMVEYSGEPVESADSNVVTITMSDVFPPSAPMGLVLVPVPAQNAAPAHIDLSWNINPETDVVGYNVYRSEQEGTPGSRLNSQVLPTPVFSDMSPVAGKPYFYRVTAVDRSGNESTPSPTISGEVPTESQPKR